MILTPDSQFSRYAVTTGSSYIRSKVVFATKMYGKTIAALKIAVKI